MPIKIIKVMIGASENYIVHYNPSNVPKPLEELQILDFPFIERLRDSLNTLDASDPSPTACYLLEFMDRGRTIMLQDVAQLIDIGRTHILFHHAVFKTGLLLKYKYTMGTFFSTSVNQVSHSLKYVLPELSIQVTNLHFDINGHQNTSMDFLFSNFRQINYNAVTVKNNVACTTTVSDMRNCFRYFSRYERCSNPPELLAYESINPRD